MTDKAGGEFTNHADEDQPFPANRAMIDWLPASDAPTVATMNENFLLWCPALRVSGPAVTAYLQDGKWTYSYTGKPLPPEIDFTHFARINQPDV